ncbi:RNA polymerase III C11 subunit [Puccinia graminis f. sp. tritici]|uniref:DNA-directed RNA polymerase subunit n=1 Tax=Puccinia graminis f. sp. tritici TaxID=56615 RepID=A0A5B0QSF0_PUCGR|nr:RNA polymerase III C11 subunit [Puccinia graminis f. sp. tritici]
MDSSSCPTCSNMLVVSRATGENKFECSTCPYEYPIYRNYTDRTVLTRKEADDVLGGEDAWKNVDQTEAQCPKCDNNRAFYMQLQIRSADEPMTTFYRCTVLQCSAQWRDQ